MKKRIRQLIVMIFVVTILLSGQTIEKTVAWLQGRTDEVTNTFTYGKVDIELTETDTLIDQDNDPTTNTYLMDLENTNITKDAKITVKANSEPSWVFVEIVEENEFDEYLKYELDSNVWNPLETYSGIYYTKVITKDENQVIDVFKNQTVTLEDGVTKESLNTLTSYPKLTIKGYAIQEEGIDSPIEAWSLLKDYASNQDGVNS